MCFQMAKGGKRTLVAGAVTLALAGAAGVVFAGVLALVPGHIGRILYGAPHIAPLIRPLSVAAPFVYLGIVSSGVLHGLGQIGPVTANVFAGNLIRCILIYTLVPRPAWGILGAVWALVADHVVTAILNIACLGWFMRDGREIAGPRTRTGMRTVKGTATRRPRRLHSVR